MYKYLLSLLLLVSFSVFADTGGKYTTDTKSFADYPTAAKCAGHAGDGEVNLIDEASDWSTINDAGVYYYCVEPGDYTVDVDITKSCTSGQRCYIWYYNTAETEETHPVDMIEADRAIIEELFFLDLATVESKYWVVDRMTIRDAATDSALRFQPDDGDNIIVTRCLLEDTGGSSGMLAAGGENNLIQGCVIRNSSNAPNLDDHGIVFYGTAFQVIGNEMYNFVGDAIQVSGGATGGVIAHNEMYITPAYYSDDSGNLDPDGVHMCAENALDAKGGGSGAFPFSAANQLLIVENYMWGWNRDDAATGCATGAGSVGLAIVLHGVAGDGDGIRFESNVITSGPNSIAAYGGVGANPTAEDHSFINNLWYDLDQLWSIPASKSNNFEFYYNTVLNVPTFMDGEDVNEFLCNAFINMDDDGAALGASSTADYNAFFKADDTNLTNTNDYVGSLDGDSKNEMYCYPRNMITNLSAECVPLASTTKESPHGDICNAPTETASRGVDDVTRLSRIRAGFVAPYLQHTFEYEEHQSDGVFTFVAPIEDFYQVWFRATTTDADDNSLSYSVSGSGGQNVTFSHPATEWRKGKTNTLLAAGLHTITVVEREAGIVIDKITITNDPDFTI